MDLQTTGFSVNSLKSEDKFLNTGCNVLNQFLRGGISKRGVTQIYGEAGSGKTQLALQLSITGQIPSADGSSSGVIYVSTEAAFPSKRLNQLLEESPIARKHKLSGDAIFIEHVSTISDLESCIINRIPVLLRSKRISLLIIDSIAAPFRCEYEEKELKNRASSLRKIGEALHMFSREFNITVICINQVSALMNESNQDVCQKNQPSLGIIWCNQVTNSLSLCKVNGKRHLHVIQSPYLSQKMIFFEIKQSGVFGLK